MVHFLIELRELGNLRFHNADILDFGCFIRPVRPGKVSLQLRTHVVVSVACSLIMTLSIFAIKLVIKDNEQFSSLTYDASRIAAGILGGIGFMGAGAIVKNGFNIKGLTTAATLLFASAIGMACGSGFVLEATGVTLLVLLLMMALLQIEKILDKKSPYIVIATDNVKEIADSIKEEAGKEKLVIKNFYPEIKKDENGKDYCEISVILTFYANMKSITTFLESIRKIPGVKNAGIVKKNKYLDDSY